jgi:hypothetical protein
MRSIADLDCNEDFIIDDGAFLHGISPIMVMNYTSGKYDCNIDIL